MFKCRQGSCFLVAIEGADSVGKATQAALLEKGLNDKGIRAFRTEVPWGDNLTYDPIYKMLREGTALSEPVVFQALQACNRRTMQGTYLPNLSRHFDIVILDAYSDVVNGSINEMEVSRRFINKLRIISRDHQCAFLVLHHFRKGDNSRRGKNDVSGSQGFEGAMRLVLSLENGRNNKMRINNFSGEPVFRS